MNIILLDTNTTPTMVLQEIVNDLTKIGYEEVKHGKINMVEAVEMIPSFKEAISKLASSQQPAVSGKNLRLCKVEPNTDSFYFHEFVFDKLHLSTIDLKPSPQHPNFYVPNLFTTALVEDKKCKIFYTYAEHLKFID